ncbi:MAG: transcriptional regulator [Pacificimonas sp.]
MAEDEDADGRFDYREIDDLIHGRVRLAVMAYLSGAKSADFADLKHHAKVTDGNLSVHLRKLEDAGYVRVEKTFVDRKPLTVAHMTAEGREAWIGYLDNLKAMLGEGGRL